MSAADAFLDRVFTHLPAVPASGFDYRTWNHAGRPTNEGVGLMRLTGFDPEKVVASVLDVAAYPRELSAVTETRISTNQGGRLNYYQRIHVPVLGDLHMQLNLYDKGERDGWRLVAWDQDDAGTAALDRNKGIRSDYNVGAWLIRPDAVGYALSSSPRKDDVGRLKFAALTKGADAGAAKMLKVNIEGMVAWARRR
ncbi:MAG: hypothetical protein H6742_09810 [Alphaproteobacteria bacterium]|nr:hypothetical protein [Alphaproteobacteria bacterium]